MTARPRGRDDSAQARARRLVNAGVVWSISRTTRATTRGPGTDRRQLRAPAPDSTELLVGAVGARTNVVLGEHALAGVALGPGCRRAGALTAAGARARPRARRAGSHPSPRWARVRGRSSPRRPSR